MSKDDKPRQAARGPQIEVESIESLEEMLSPEDGAPTSPRLVEAIRALERQGGQGDIDLAGGLLLRQSAPGRTLLLGNAGRIPTMIEMQRVLNNYAVAFGWSASRRCLVTGPAVPAYSLCLYWRLHEHS